MTNLSTNDVLNWTECSSLVATLFISFGIGAYYWYFKGNASVERELVSQKMSFVPLTASIVASAITGVAFLGYPTESYTHGISYSVYLCMGIVLSGLIFVKICLPIVYDLQLDNLYEYFDRRFDHRVRRLATVIFVLAQIGFSALTSYPPAVLINQFSGIGISYVTFGMMAFCSLYTLLGGFKGVVIIDMFQSIIMILTVVVILPFGFDKAGGFTKVWSFAMESGRLTDFTLNPDPTIRLSLWSGAIGPALTGIAYIGMNQSAYQRYVSFKSVKQSKWACVVLVSSLITFDVTMAIIGLQAYATYYGCDPKAAGMVPTYPNAIIYWINDVGLHVHGLRGIFTAGVLSASMSTISTNLNSVAGVIFLELFQTKCENMTAGWSKIVSGVLVVVAGLASGATYFVIKDGGSILELFSCFTAVAGGVTVGLFGLGMLTISANATGSFWGALTSLAVISTLAIGSRLYIINGLIPVPPVKIMRTDMCPNASQSIPESWSAVNETAHYVLPIFKISTFYYGPIAVFLTVVTGLVVSYFTAGHDGDETKSPDLFFKPLRKYLKGNRRLFVSDKDDNEETEQVPLNVKRCSF